MDTQDVALLVGAAGVLVSALTYFAGIRRGEAQERSRQRHAELLQELDHQHQAALEDQRLRETAIARVVDDYMKLLRSATTSGVYGLADSGIASLRDDQDAREAVRRIALQAGKNPLGTASTELAKIDLVKFFRFFRERGLRFEHTSVADAIAKMWKEGMDPTRLT